VTIFSVIGAIVLCGAAALAFQWLRHPQNGTAMRKHAGEAI
jgi:hypothetical protein